MVAYLDSSVLLRHILLGEVAIQQALACGHMVSSELIEIECRRVIQRCRLQGELDDEGLITAMDRLGQVLRGMSLVKLGDPVKKRSMEAFPVSVKTLDALHLSSALLLAEREPEIAVLVFSHDPGMNRCAKALGFQTPLLA
jgi:hypothetical protein